MKTLVLAIALLAVTILTYVNAINHPFVHDDVVFIEQNPHIQSLDLKAIFLEPTSPALAGANAYYRPFLELVYRLEYAVFGLNPHAFHAVNVVWHAINALLVFALGLSLGIPLLFAWSIALFFGVHPVQSEAVACVAGVSNIAATFFILVGWIAYLHRWILLMAIAFGIGLFAKETVIVLLPIVGVTAWYLRRKSKRFLLLLTVLIAMFLSWRHLLTSSDPLRDVGANLGELQLRLWHVPSALMNYLRVIVWPGDLHYYRNLDILSMWWPAWLGLAVLIGFLKFLTPNDREERRLYWFGWIIFLVSLSPVLNILPLINEYSLILVADHFVYLPLVGALIALGCLLRQWLLPSRQAIVVGVTVLLCAFGAAYHNSFWQNEITLFERTVQFEPRFGRGQALLAKAYYFNKRYVKSIEHYEYAQEIFEGYVNKVENPVAKRFYLGFLKGIHFEKAQAYAGLSKWPQAKQEYVQAINIDPNDVVLYINLATIHMGQEEWEEAKVILQKALSLSPTDIKARNNLGICFAKTGSPELAQSTWQQILIENPNFLPAKQNLEHINKQPQI